MVREYVVFTYLLGSFESAGASPSCEMAASQRNAVERCLYNTHVLLLRERLYNMRTFGVEICLVCRFRFWVQRYYYLRRVHATSSFFPRGGKGAQSAPLSAEG